LLALGRAPSSLLLVTRLVCLAGSAGLQEPIYRGGSSHKASSGATAPGASGLTMGAC
jgi:hypothetical protein